MAHEPLDQIGGLDNFVGARLADSLRLLETPAGAAADSFRQAIDWLKSEPREKITVEDMRQVAKAAEAVQTGKIDEAISTLRQLHNNQLIRIKHHPLNWVRPRKKETIVGSLLSGVLTRHAVERINSAIEKLQSAQTGMGADVFIQLLKAMSRQNSQYSVLEPLMFTDRFSDYRPCDICDRRPVVAELKLQSRKWNLCAACVANAEGIQSQLNRPRRDLIAALKAGRDELVEAVALSASSAHARQNLQTCRELLGKLGES